MIILLDDGVVDEGALEKPTTAAAIEALYSAMGRGEHYVIASRRALQKMLKANASSVNVKAILKWCLQNYSFLAGLPQNIPAGMRVVADGPTKKLEEGMWQTSVEEVARAGVRPVVLLAENSVDARLFKHAAKHYLLSKDLGTINVTIEDRNGNGSGIAAELENLIKRRVEWCLCIPDSDRCCPDGPVGINAQQCANVAGKAAWPVNFRTTAGRELENDVPRTALNDVASARVAVWREHTNLVTGVCGDILPYADIKKGIRACNIRTFPIGSKERIYWESANEAYATVVPPGETCPEGEECEVALGCTLLPAAGEGIGAAILDMFDKEAPHCSYKTHKASTNFDSWLELGHVVARQGLSPKRMRL